MLRSLLIAVSCLATGGTGGAQGADVAGFHVAETQRLFHPDHPRHWRGAQTQALITRIWYPADAAVRETPHDIGEAGHPIFRGHPLAVDAPLSSAQATWPLLVMSHGIGGSADSLDWLGSALAEAGYVVVAVNHPGTNALEPLTREGFILLWERATDLSDALDGVLADPTFGSHLDRARIGAVGFSLGGYTVLELAGARTVPDALQAFCLSPAADAICHPPEMDRFKGKVDAAFTPSPETAASLARAGDSYWDERVKAVFAIAPALGEAFGPGSFNDIRVPIALIAGDADPIAPVGTNIRRFGGFLPSASLSLLPGVGHYTFLDTCVPAMVERLATLCKDAPGVDREAIHQEAIDRARAFFAGTLG